MSPLSATLTRCRDKRPLIDLHAAPFNGLEIRPAELRMLAQQLMDLADAAERLPTKGKYWRPTTVVMQVNA